MTKSSSTTPVMVTL